MELALPGLICMLKPLVQMTLLYFGGLFVHICIPFLYTPCALPEGFAVFCHLSFFLSPYHPFYPTHAHIFFLFSQKSPGCQNGPRKRACLKLHVARPPPHTLLPPPGACVQNRLEVKALVRPTVWPHADSPRSLHVFSVSVTMGLSLGLSVHGCQVMS